MALSHSDLARGKVPEGPVELVAKEPSTLGGREPASPLGEKTLGEKTGHSVIKPRPKERASSEHKLRLQSLDQARAKHEIFGHGLSLRQKLKREGQRAEARVLGKLTPGRCDRKANAHGVRRSLRKALTARLKSQVRLKVEHA